MVGAGRGGVRPREHLFPAAEAAHAHRSTAVYSEDLSHGQDYGGVRVVNPFLPTL